MLETFRVRRNSSPSSESLLASALLFTWILNRFVLVSADLPIAPRLAFSFRWVWARFLLWTSLGEAAKDSRENKDQRFFLSHLFSLPHDSRPRNRYFRGRAPTSPSRFGWPLSPRSAVHDRELGRKGDGQRLLQFVRRLKKLQNGYRRRESFQFPLHSPFPPPHSFCHVSLWVSFSLFE